MGVVPPDYKHACADNGIIFANGALLADVTTDIGTNMHVPML